jgi:hypothetical protein
MRHTEGDAVSDTQDIKSLLASLVTAGRTLAIAWKDKAIAQAKPKAKSAGIMGGAFGAAGYFAMNAVSLLFLAGAAGFGALYSSFLGPWGATGLGLVTMAVVLLVLAAILALIGKAQLPELQKKLDIAEDVQAGTESIKVGIEKGKAEVAAELEGVREIELR